MEAVGVTGGIINSTYTTFGENHTFTGYIPAVPMIALAVAEFGRVPLALRASRCATPSMETRSTDLLL